MKKLTFVLSILFVVIVAGCTGARRPSVPPGTVRTAPDEVAQPPVKVAESPAAAGIIKGTLLFDDFARGGGNVFIYIIDEMKMPQEISVIASTMMPMEDIKAKNVPFTLMNVPPGTWSVIAIWDISPPFCIVTEAYCEASARDGIGLSDLVKVGAGETVEQYSIDGSNRPIVIPIY